jgi:hypothetical protein
LVTLAVLVLAIIVLVKYEKKEKYELQTKNSNCPKCSGHGTCDTSTGKCKCDPDWTRFDCRVPTAFINANQPNLPYQFENTDYWEQLLQFCPRIAEMSQNEYGWLIHNIKNEIISKGLGQPLDMYQILQKYGLPCYSCK